MKTFLLIVFVVGAIASILVGIIIYDSSELKHYSFRGVLVDKWHEVACIPLFSAEGQYVGESCDDIFTVIINSNGDRIKTEVRSSQFAWLKIGSAVEYQYDRGRIGLVHNKSISTINQANSSITKI